MTDAFALDVTRLYDEWSLHDAALFAGTEAVLRSTSTYHGPGVETVRAALDNAAAVAERIEALLDAGVAPPDVGVIAAYSGQVREILSRLGTLDRETTGLTVDTVDSFQAASATPLWCRSRAATPTRTPASSNTPRKARAA
jgi:hypothetical protein